MGKIKESSSKLIIQNDNTKTKKPKSGKKNEKRKLKIHKINTKSEEQSDNDEMEIEKYEPTKEELRASEMPENIYKVETIRQKKKKKHQKNVETQKGNFAQKEMKRNEIYLNNWKNNQSEWKFEKLRQISIQMSILDEDKINGTLWPIALEYLAGTKGAARKNLTEFAEKEIEKLDQEFESTKNNSSIKSEKYKRARELLQLFG